METQSRNKLARKNRQQRLVLERDELRAEIARLTREGDEAVAKEKTLRKLAIDLAMGRTRFEHGGDEGWVVSQIDAALREASGGEDG